MMKENSPTSKPGYLVVWKYKIKQDEKREFEREYGPDGTWSKFFEQASGYKGSFLQRSESNPNTYLLIDEWDNATVYRSFIEGNMEVYNALSARFEKLYISEEKVGAFESISF